MVGYKEEDGNIFEQKPKKLLGVYREEDTDDKFVLVAFEPDNTRKIKYTPSLSPIYSLDDRQELLIEFFM